jgi:hypothetical protein
MKLPHVLLLALALPLLLARSPAGAEETPRWRLNNVPLDMPLDDALDGEYLEGIYQEKLAARLVDSVGLPWPAYHIHSTLRRADGTGEEKMELHFTNNEDGRRIFWVRVNSGPLPAGASADDVLPQLERQFGVADRLYVDAEGSGSALLLFVDKSLPEDQRQRIAGNLPAPAALTPDQFRGFWDMSLADRAQLLSVDFRGAIAIVNAWKGELKSLQTELLDLRGAATVYTLR